MASEGLPAMPTGLGFEQKEEEEEQRVPCKVCKRQAQKKKMG